MTAGHERRERERERVIAAGTGFLSSVEALGNHLGRIEALITAEGSTLQDVDRTIDALPDEMKARLPEVLGPLTDWVQDVGAERVSRVASDARTAALEKSIDRIH